MSNPAVRCAVVALGVWAVCLFGSAAPRKHVIVDGNRTRAVHHIPLYDENYNEIRPDDDAPMPFSTRNTCGDCHDYEKISMGWHFNSSLNVTQPGRPGEPWVLVDEQTGTQLPLSYREWPGTWRPEEVAMSYWDFVKTFGHHMPGGDMGEKDEETPDPKARWNVSGQLEINCLACHNACAEQNQSEWAVQVGRENFRWAATGASAMGVVENMASRLPDWYDLIDGPNKDNAWAAVPEVVYESWRFSKKNFAFFDMQREGTTNRCYYCHSSVPRNVDVDKVWAWDMDVHMAAGLTCTDCHRNGLDHFIVRGYEGERSDPAFTTLTCRGCHLGDPSGEGFEFKGGRIMAPRPLHRGLPAVHLEKMTCTACHSGLLPGDKTERVRTARANRLGIHGRAQWDTELPYILSPVFVRQEQGRIEPREILWPAFWGRMKGDAVTPLPLEIVSPVVAAIREADRLAKLEAERHKQDMGVKPPTEKPPEPPPEKPKEEGARSEADPSESISDATKEKPAPPEGEKVEQPAAEAAAPAPEPVPEEVEPLTEQQVIKVLTNLAASNTIDGQPVYVSGGKVYRLAQAGSSLETMDHAVAKPYSWPFAHDVRPASQSLGARGCCDCHEEDSNFFFGEVAAATPTPLGAPAMARMYEIEELDPVLLAVLDEGVDLRTAFIIAGVILAVVLGVALVHYGFLGLEGLLRLMVAPGVKK